MYCFSAFLPCFQILTIPVVIVLSISQMREIISAQVVEEYYSQGVDCTLRVSIKFILGRHAPLETMCCWHLCYSLVSLTINLWIFELLLFLCKHLLNQGFQLSGQFRMQLVQRRLTPVRTFSSVGYHSSNIKVTISLSLNKIPFSSSKKCRMLR